MNPSSGSQTRPSSPSFSPQVQKALNEFALTDDNKVPAELSKVVADIAACGLTRYAWPSLRHLLRVMFQNVVTEYVASSGKPSDVDGESFDERYRRVVHMMDEWPNPPFTLQRMCELLIDPNRFYRNTNKYFQAFSKLVHGISAPNVPSLDNLDGSKDHLGFVPKPVEESAPMEYYEPTSLANAPSGAGGIMSTTMPGFRPQGISAAAFGNSSVVAANETPQTASATPSSSDDSSKPRNGDAAKPISMEE